MAGLAGVARGGSPGVVTGFSVAADWAWAGSAEVAASGGASPEECGARSGLCGALPRNSSVSVNSGGNSDFGALGGGKVGELVAVSRLLAGVVRVASVDGGAAGEVAGCSGWPSRGMKQSQNRDCSSK